MAQGDDLGCGTSTSINNQRSAAMQRQHQQPGASSVPFQQRMVTAAAPTCRNLSSDSRHQCRHGASRARTQEADA